MKAFVANYWKIILFFTVIGLVGGFFVGIYMLDSYPEEIQQQLFAELEASGLGNLPADVIIGVITAFQSAGYGFALGTIGIILGKKTGLWRDERSITTKPLIAAIVVSFAGGLALILPDILFFGCYSEAIMNSYAVKPTIPYLIATVTYGAVIEEVMLRLFFMSLIAFVLHRLSRKNEKPSNAVLVIANLIVAVLFAVGHLPATLMLFGNSPMIIFRCMVLNGGFGLTFGWLYRKYGLRYAMIAHGGCHIISKLIWILFL